MSPLPEEHGAPGSGPNVVSRWQLYRLLSDPVRLRLLALASREELAMGELAELLGESQPNVSRHAAPLRQAGLLGVRRQGTRTLARLVDAATGDPVVADAVATGRKLCAGEGSLARIEEVVRARDAKTREFFANARQADHVELAPELPAYLFALRSLRGRSRLAVDVGTGDGSSLDALAPLFTRVVALDRSDAQLNAARHRITKRGYDNVYLLRGEADGDEVRAAVGEGADCVLAARMLHHAPRPRQTFEALVRLLRPGGRVVVLDYEAYDDESFRDRQADVWMGFDRGELERMARDGGLEAVALVQIPDGCTGTGPDQRRRWLALVGDRPRGEENDRGGSRRRR